MARLAAKSEEKGEGFWEEARRIVPGQGKAFSWFLKDDLRGKKGGK